MDIDQKMEKMQELYDDWAECERCGLCNPQGRQRHNVVFGEGNPNADIMVIGEAPGEHEDLTGRPFYARSGEVLSEFIALCNGKRGDVFVTNIVGCRPTDDENPDVNRKPVNKEIKACLERVYKTIRLVDPYVIILLGTTALKTLTEEKKKITYLAHNLNATTVTIPGEMVPVEYPAIATFHPSYLLRNWIEEPGSDVDMARQAYLKAFWMADTYAELYRGDVPPPRVDLHQVLYKRR